MSNESEQAQNPQQPQTFQERIIDLTKTYMQGLQKTCPELRSVAVIFDWTGGLNNAAVPYTWGGVREDGIVDVGNLPVIHGMGEQLAKFLRAQTELVAKSIAALQQHSEFLQRQILQGQEKLKEKRDGGDSSDEAQTDARGEAVASGKPDRDTEGAGHSPE